MQALTLWFGAVVPKCGCCYKFTTQPNTEQGCVRSCGPSDRITQKNTLLHCSMVSKRNLTRQKGSLEYYLQTDGICQYRTALKHPQHQPLLFEAASSDLYWDLCRTPLPFSSICVCYQPPVAASLPLLAHPPTQSTAFLKSRSAISFTNEIADWGKRCPNRSESACRSELSKLPVDDVK